MPVNPIPDGYHSVTPYLCVRDASAAIEFYKKAFSAEEFCRIPGPGGQGVMHAEIRINGSPLMLSDEMAEWGHLSAQSIGSSPVTIHLFVPDVDATIAKAVSHGAKVTAPATDMFWGDRYGKIKDPFGHNWSIATHMEDVTPEMMTERAQKAFAGTGA
jgi:uncharacterized glyoxalase superfamily protein PhnB